MTVVYRHRPNYRKIAQIGNPPVPRLKGKPDLSDVERAAVYLDPRQSQLPNKPRRQMADGWVNLTVPRGNERELCSHGELGFIPFRVSTPSGVVWLVQVPEHVVPYLTRGAGFAVAPPELQSAQPPSGPIRGVNAVPL